MEITFNTPALLFPAISLLLLAYTNRFVALSNRIRTLHSEYKETRENLKLILQIKSLKKRINLIRYMQGLGVFSFFLCVTTMYSTYMEWYGLAEISFTISLICLLGSIFISFVEIIKSTNAIELELSDIEGIEPSNLFTRLLSK